jgi:peptidyl-prolyl cis-trans isomerase B (cyclophilin B)
MDEGRNSKIMSKRGNRPRMINMAMGDEYRSRSKFVLSNDLHDTAYGVLTGIDDQTRLPCGWSDDKAIGAPRARWKSCHNHAGQPSLLAWGEYTPRVSNTNKRQRELAHAKYERQQARKGNKYDNRRRRQQITAAVTVAVLVLGTVGWVLISNQSTTPEAAATLKCVGSTTTTTTPLSFKVAPKPDASIAAGTQIVLDTNCGPIVISTLAKLAPATVASEVFLAKQGYYDKTPCHRLTTSGIFVLQCGDPTGTGSGGPGYTVPDENLPTAAGVNYPAGTVAMANAGPGTSGSQFFLVYEDTTLPPNYTIWGTVTSGLDLVQAIASVGDAGGTGDGAPTQPVVIERATVRSA